MVIAARFESTCPTCRQRIEVGAQVNWSRGEKAAHAVCPPLSIEDRAARLADNALADRTVLANLFSLQAEAQEDGIGPSALVFTALELAADYLLAEYDGQTAAWEERQARDAAGGQPVGYTADAPALTAAAAAMLPKGIYRVSLTGAERVYGTDHVNVQVVPNEKYQNVKVGEWHGESIGTYSTARGFRFWPSVDPTGSRTLAIKAAFVVLIEAADPIEYAKAYAVAASSCWRCGADLVDEQSRARLMGPDCYRQNERGA